LHLRWQFPRQIVTAARAIDKKITPINPKKSHLVVGKTNREIAVNHSGISTLISSSTELLEDWGAIAETVEVDFDETWHG